jgi:cardiolipin synthase
MTNPAIGEINVDSRISTEPLPGAPLWEREELIFNGDTFYRRIASLIDSATKTIDIECYYFAVDRAGELIFRHLLQASRRGVAVRLIVDGIGSLGWAWRYEQRCRTGGIRFKIYHQLPWARMLFDRPEIEERSRSFFDFIYRINKRNHRKVFLFDQQIAVVGSRNITEVHAEQWKRNQAWRDTSILVEGTEVRTLQATFDYIWNSHRLRRRFTSAFRAKPASLSGLLVRHNLSRATRRKNYADLLARVGSARSRIWITNAYFVPHRTLLDALAAAAQRGCDVKILVPSASDIFFLPWATAALQKGLLDAGSKVFEYLPSILHAKTIIIDDWEIVGSSNLNHRSLFHDLETDVVVSRSATRTQLAAQFLRDLDVSREVSGSEWESRGLLWRVLGNLVLTFRWWF